jgi:hypothetical protein
MLIVFDDKEYQLDVDEMDVVEARHIKRKTGMGLLELQEGLMKVDPDALVALYWLMMKQSGVGVDMDRVNFKVAKFGRALRDAVEREEQAAGEEDEAAPEVPKDEI